MQFHLPAIGVKTEGIPSDQGVFFQDIKKVKLAPWDRNREGKSEGYPSWRRWEANDAYIYRNPSRSKGQRATAPL